jgi:hypothetical protein
MRRGDRDRPKPGLARAHQPFTPITHQPVKSAETPFQPLHVTDLETPKVNKSDSNSDPSTDIGIAAEDEFTTSDQDFKALRHALLGCIGIVDRMSRKNAERRSATTQTSAEPIHRPPKQFDETEVIPGDRLDPMGLSPVAKVAQPMKPKNPMKKEEEPRKPLYPINRNVVEPVKLKSDITHGSEEGSTAVEDDGNLQKRLHEMSLLLKRLENQIDGVNDPEVALV